MTKRRLLYESFIISPLVGMLSFFCMGCIAYLMLKYMPWIKISPTAAVIFLFTLGGLFIGIIFGFRQFWALRKLINNPDIEDSVSM